MDDILNTHFTEVETLVAIDQLKGNCSAGADGIPAEVFKNFRHLLVPTMTTLFNYCLEKGEYPEGWSEGVITPTHKGGGGGGNSPENYRRITVLNSICKIFEMCVKNRFEYGQEVSQTADKCNGGLKKDSQTSDNVLLLYVVIQKCKIEKQNLYVAFMDFRWAFDTMNRGMMFYILIKKGFKGKLVNVIRDMYRKTKCRVKKH